MSAKKSVADGHRILELLRDPALSSRDVAARVGASPEAVDETRVLIEDLPTAEIDAILALPPALARATLLAASTSGRYDVIAEAFGVQDKEIQKEARRLAHLLRLRGFDVGAPARTTPAPPPVEPAPAELPTLLSSFDSHGERLAFWSRALPGHGIEVAQIVLSSVSGVASLSLGELSRKRFRELCEELRREESATIVEVQRDRVRQAIDRARLLGREHGEMPASFIGWAAKVLGPAPAIAPPPLGPEGEGRPPEGEEELTALARESASLFSEREVDPWMPEEAAVQRAALRIGEALASPLYLSGSAGEMQRREAVSAALGRAIEAYFEPALRTLWAERLSETAFLLERTARPGVARVAAATALRLAGGAPVVELPFCTELFARRFPPRTSTTVSEPERPATSGSGLLLPPGADLSR